MRKVFTTLALGGLLLGALPSAEVRADPKDDSKPVKYSFPSSVAGVDFGRKALKDAITTDKLDSRRVADKIFRNLPLLEMARILKFHLGSNELRALDRELDKLSLTTLISSSPTAFALAKQLDDKGISESEIARGLEDIFDEFYPQEVVAYLAEQGLSEGWLLSRLQNSQHGVDALERFEKRLERDKGEAKDLYKSLVRDHPFTTQLGFLLGIRGVQTAEQWTRLYKENDKILTPESLRVLQFRDPALAERVLKRDGLTDSQFADHFEELTEAKGGKVVSFEAIAEREDARLHAEILWLRSLGPEVSHVFEGSSRGGTLPVLGSLEGSGDKWQELADFGLSVSLASYFKPAADLRMVVYAKNQVRAQIGSTRYEGLWDKETGNLDLVAVYGGRDRRFEGLKLHGSGLFLEMKIRDADAGRSAIMLRRSLPW